MLDVQLDPRLVRMPPFAEGAWLNTNGALSREQLHGRVLLIDFWDYACINCLRTLPYLAAWHGRYAPHGLTIIGIHSPEFKFGQNRAHLETAVARYQIQYPLLVDNRYENWSNYANKAWPTKYLVDGGGYLRLKRQGEGYYQEIERAIQILLRQINPDLPLPMLLPPLREEDAPGAVCYRPTPELYAGYQGGGLFGGALGNPEGYFPQNPVFYELPKRPERQEGQFYVAGAWRAWPEALAFAGNSGGRVVLPYAAASVNAVLAPSADEVELALHLRPTAAEAVVEIRQDGRYLSQLHAGDDVLFTETGVSYVLVDQPRMYQLVENPVYERHELELTFRAMGMALFAFTFTGCVAASTSAADAGPPTLITP